MRYYNRVIDWKNKTKRNQMLFILLAFTFLFLLFSVAVYGYWIVHERSFVWEIDGSKQHYPALVYLGVWLRDIVRNILQGNGLVIPLWDMDLGYGGDILTTLNYYSFGDPLDLLAFFVPYKYMEYLYGFLAVFRMYLAGLAFIFYCKKMKHNDFPSILGGIIYCFSGYAMLFAVRHPFFINPMIYLPLILVGMEKLLKKEKSFLFHFMIMISLISNFYFFYMLTIVLFVYALFRYWQLYRHENIKCFLEVFLKSVWAYLLAVFNSAIIFLPVLIAFLNTERSEAAWPEQLLFYGKDYYSNLLSYFISPVVITGWNDYSTHIGVAGVALLCFLFVLLERNKKHFTIWAMGIGMLIGLLIPMFGFAMNGFAYICNRWSFALIFLMALSFVICEERLRDLKQKEWLVGIIVAILLAVTVFLLPEATTKSNIIMLLVFVCVLEALRFGNVWYKKTGSVLAFRILLVGCILVDVGAKAYCNFSLYQDNLISEYYESGVAFRRLTDTAITDVLKVDTQDHSFRVDSLERESRNYGVLERCSTVSTYFSITPGENTMFSRLLGNAAEECTVSIGNLDSRLGLNTLFGVRYVSTNSAFNNSKIPYGYELIKEEDQKRYNGTVVKASIYENTLNGGMIYAYDNVMSRSEFEAHSVDKRESLMLENLILEDESKYLNKYSSVEGYTGQVLLQKQEILEQLNENPNIDVKDDKIYVYGELIGQELTFEGVPNAETYLYLEGTDYEHVSQYDLYFMTHSGASKITKNKLKKEDVLERAVMNTRIKALNEDVSSLYEFKTDISTTKGIDTALLNVGYEKEPLHTMEMRFQHAGIYSFDDLKVIAQPMEDYEESITEMSNLTIEEFCVEGNTLSAKVILPEERMLCIAVPYSKGWDAKLNGEAIEVEQGNIMFMTMQGEAGENIIEMEYCTPGLKVGAVVTLISSIVVVLYYAVFRKKQIK